MAISLTCKSCGRPLDTEQARPGGTCGSCGTRQPLDEASWAQLRAYCGRLRRGEQRLRTAVMFQVATGLTEVWAGKLGCAFLVVLIGGLSLGGLSIVPIVLNEDALGTPLTLLLAFAVMGAMCLGLALSMLGVIWAGGRISTRAARLARQAGTDGLNSTLDATCSQCGAHAQVLAAGGGPPMECPYCQSPLVVAQEAGDLMAVALKTLAAGQEAIGTQAYDKVYRKLSGGRPPRKPDLPPFTADGGVFSGDFDGVPVWAGDDSVGGFFVARVEVDLDLPLTGRTWFVARKARGRLEEVAGTWNIVVPTDPSPTGNPRLDRRFIVLADDPTSPGRLAARTDVQALLDVLDDGDSALFEPSGLSQWRTASSVFAIFGRLSPKRYAQRARPLARVAAGLLASP